MAKRDRKNYPALQADAVLSGMDLMKYDAINVGEGELSLGTGFFQDMAAKITVPFVSANIAGREGGLPLIMPYLLKEFGPVRVGITGITSSIFFKEDFLEKEGIEVKGPVRALQEALDELRGKTDIIILLSHLGYQGTVNLFRYNQLPGVDVAIAGHGRKLLNRPEEINGTIIVQSSLTGQYLGRLVLTLGPDRSIRKYEGDVVALTKDTPEDQRAVEIMEEFKERKREEKERLGEEKKRRELREQQTKYLKMTPQEFLEMMKRENEKGGTSGQFPAVP